MEKLLVARNRRRQLAIKRLGKFLDLLFLLLVLGLLSRGEVGQI